MVNMTNVSGIENLQGIAYYTNNMTNGILFTGAMIVFFFIIAIILVKREEPFANILSVSSWSAFIFSIFFWYAELVPTIVPLSFLFLAVFGVFMMYADR